MKFNFLYLILGVLFGIFVFFLFMQKEHNTKELVSQIDSVKERLTVLEIPPQTGEDAEKIKLATQLAEANTKLITADFDKLKLELKESNQQWLWGWTGFLGVMFAVFGLALWFVVKSMISGKVEEHLKGFQEVFDQVNELKDELGVLKKELAVTVLDNFDPGYPVELERHTEGIKAISDEILLEIFSDKARELGIRWAAADVLVTRKSPRLVSPMLTFLNSIVISNIDTNIYHARFCDPHIYWDWLSRFCNEKTYQGLKDFLNRLIKRRFRE